MAEQSWHAKLNLLRRQTPATHFFVNLPSANNLPPGLTGQRSSGCFLYMAQRFPAANIFHSGISRPTISRRPIFLYRANLSLSLSFSIFFLFFCSLFFLFFLLLSVFFAFFHILYHPIYRIFIFSVFFCGFLHKKTASITGCCKFSFFAFFVQKILCILILK